MNTKTYTTFLRNSILSLTILIGLYGCSKDEPAITTPKQPLTFTGALENEVPPASGFSAAWKSGDQIGVYAVKSGQQLNASSISDGADNVPYVTESGNGYFTANGKQVTYPDNNASIDIIAYYPYSANVTNFNYTINIAEQKDFFYSNNIKGANQLHQLQNLTFRRPALADVKIIISTAAANSSLKGMQTAVNTKTKATFSLVTEQLTVDQNSTGTFQPATPGSDYEKQVTLLLLPTQKENEVSVVFSLDSKKYTFNIPNILQSGNKYNYSVQINPATSQIKLVGYVELPEYTTEVAPNAIRATHLVDETLPGLQPNSRNYTILYDTQNRLPYWVAYPMTADYLGNTSRTDLWEYDPIIPQSVQPILFSSWGSPSGYQRGHIIPSGDRTASVNLNKKTFYFTNMAAQNGDMNGGVWADLENRLRYWTTKYDTVYVVTGTILPKSPEPITYAKDKQGNSSAIPKFFYKILLGKKDITYKSIAFKMENVSTETSYKNNIVSVADIEKETGFKFFPTLSPDMANQVKQNTTLVGDWD